MSIFSELKKAGKKMSFHTPGHKGGLCAEDGTEIENVFPGLCIEEAQNNAARHYGANAVRFLVNGSSIGVKAMIMSAGGNIIAPENRHISADEGAALAGVEVFYIKNNVQYGLPMPITAQQIEEAYRSSENVRAVLVVSPDYYGFSADLPAIRAVCDKLGIRMFVDSAHGAHFASSDTGSAPLFPLSASRIADACNMSAHKTMRAFTQSAYLAVNDAGLLPVIDKNLALLGTTSPSYILMGQLEEAVSYEERHADRYKMLVAEIRSITGNGFIKIRNDDPMRLVIDFSPSGISGAEACARLAERGIYAEMSSGDLAVFIVTLSDNAHNIRKLAKELRRI